MIFSYPRVLTANLVIVGILSPVCGFCFDLQQFTNAQKFYFAGDEQDQEENGDEPEYVPYIPKPYGAWFMTYGNHAKQEAQDATFGYSLGTLGFGLGLDWHYFDGWIVGLGIRFDHTDLNSDNFVGTNIDFGSTRLFLYSRYNIAPHWFINGTAAYAFHTYNTQRRGITFPFGVMEVTDIGGDIDGRQWFLELNTGYQWSCGNLQILPKIGMQYSNLSVHEYSEFGVPGLNRFFPDHHLNSLKWNADLMLAYQNSFPNIQLLPFIHGKVFYDSEQDPQELTANVLGGGSAFPTFGHLPPRTSYQVGAGFTLFGLHNMEVTMRYEYTFKHLYRDHAALIYIHHEWDANHK
ncbi:MAG TPA: autotransporter outer membrane beta-barrel domain-containing protein [Gammaproteobacteria bacterium]|nr:autotransporter outer membrane beta-barrel domain-containing protein [Gammaproteobacteria bacterium]